jgi:hypothetical protein
MTFPSHDFVLDSATKMRDAGLAAATEISEVSSVDKVIDLGAANLYMSGRLLVFATAIEVASGDEKFSIRVEGSDDDFTTLYILGQLDLGALEVTLNTLDSSPGLYVIPFSNVVVLPTGENKTVQKIRTRTVISGDIATGINYESWLVNPRL